MVQYGDPADNTPLVCMEDTYHTPLGFRCQNLLYLCDIVI
jgi:hypothetical protein